MGNTKIVLTMRNLVFGGGFWGKLFHSPCQDKKHSYWLHRLNKQIESVQKKTGPDFKKFVESLGNDFGQKGEDGKVVFGGNGLPQAAKDKREEYDAALEAYMSTTVELSLDKIPLDCFSHITLTPIDWTTMEEIAEFTEADFNKQPEAQGQNQQGLHAIGGNA